MTAQTLTAKAARLQKLLADRGTDIGEDEALSTVRRCAAALRLANGVGHAASVRSLDDRALAGAADAIASARRGAAARAAAWDGPADTPVDAVEAVRLAARLVLAGRSDDGLDADRLRAAERLCAAAAMAPAPIVLPAAGVALARRLGG